MIDLKTLMVEAKRVANAHGFYSDWQTFGEKIALIHSELSEALEEYRRDRCGHWIGHEGKPEGVAVELADAVIRIAELCESLGLDLEQAIISKQHFNASRPFKHGGKRI